MSTVNHHTALIYVMVIAAFADSRLKDSELMTINEIVKSLPIFHDFSNDKLQRITGDCVAMLDQEDGIDAVLGLAKEALPIKLRDTAYALACDVISVDGDISQEELEWLALLRKSLNIDELHATAIEFAAHARYVRHA